MPGGGGSSGPRGSLSGRERVGVRDPKPIVVYRCCFPAATNETLVGPRQQKRNAADEKNSGSGLFGNAARVTVMNRGSCAAPLKKTTADKTDPRNLFVLAK